MALGHLDSNGIWIFGESDDPDGTASGLLNLAQAATSSAIGADRARLDALEDFPQVCSLQKSASQNLTTSLVALSWDVEVSDLAGMHDNVTNNSRITPPAAGLYRGTVYVLNSNTTGLGVLQPRKNGTDIPGSFTRLSAAAAGGGAFPLLSVFIVPIAVGDYVEAMVSHATAAGNIAGGTGNSGATFTLERIA